MRCFIKMHRVSVIVSVAAVIGSVAVVVIFVNRVIVAVATVLKESLSREMITMRCFIETHKLSLRGFHQSGQHFSGEFGEAILTAKNNRARRRQRSV